MIIKRAKPFKPDYSFTAKEKIKVIRKVAEGGCGSVYKAVYEGFEGFEKTVALKVLSEKRSDKLGLDYFLNEAKLVSRLTHENIAQLHSLGQHKGHYYIVYEYISGVNLREFIRLHRYFRITLPVDIATFIISRIARALAYTHESLDGLGKPCNIIHRDVCPRNIMISTNGQPKLIDFGIAISSAADIPGRFAGKPLYMSPEQSTVSDIDFRSDIYSLGLVFFELLSGDAAREIMKGDAYLKHQVENGDVEWSNLKRELPPKLRAILMRMLNADPAMRYQSTSELSWELEAFIYSTGYGPTTNSLAKYMRLHMPHIFNNMDLKAQPVISSDPFAPKSHAQNKMTHITGDMDDDTTLVLK